MKHDASVPENETPATVEEAKTLVWMREGVKGRHRPPSKAARRNRPTHDR